MWKGFLEKALDEVWIYMDAWFYKDGGK